jgi:hypothetical protein
MSTIAPDKWETIKQELNAYPMIELARRHGVSVGEITLLMRQDGVSRQPVTQGGQEPTEASESGSKAKRTKASKPTRRTKASKGSDSGAESAAESASPASGGDSGSDEGTVVINGIACRPNTRDAAIAEKLDQLGKISDPDFGKLVGASPRVVGTFRRRHGIAPFQLDVTASDDGADSSKPASGGRRSKIDPFADLLGTVPDSVVAGKAGVSINAVSNYRRRRNIGAFDPGPLTTAAASGPTPTGRKPSKIDPYHDELGTVPDRVIAEKAGVSMNAVSNYRRRRGIAPFDPSLDQGELLPSRSETASAPAAAAAPAAPRATPARAAATAGTAGKRVYTVSMANGATAYAVGDSLLDAATRLDGVSGVTGIAYLGDLLA